MLCKNCGSQIEDKNKICPKCRNNRSADVINANKNFKGNWKCNKCGTKNNEDSECCSECQAERIYGLHFI